MADDTYIFRFTPTGDGPPAQIRVRRMLKAALRHYGLRAEWAHTVKDGFVPVVGNRNTVKTAENEPIFTRCNTGATQGGSNE